MTNVEVYLRKETGYNWQEISQLYLRFRITTSPFKQICVFTPDNIGRTLRPRLYIPENCPSLHNPGVFLNDYLNARNAVANSMPLIEFDLDSAPQLSFVIPSYPYTFTGIFSLTGRLTFSKTGSRSKLIESKNGLTLPVDIAREELAGLISASGIDIHYGLEGFSMSLEASTKTTLGKTTVRLEGNTFSAEYSPQPVKLSYDGWDIEGGLGYEASGTYTQNTPPPAKSSYKHVPIASSSPLDNSGGMGIGEKWLLYGVAGAAIGGAAACIVFTGGACTAPVAAIGSALGLGALELKFAN